jgi:alpha-amylase
LQEDALHSIYNLEDKVHAANNEALTATWRMLQTSDHFYYMCTKFAGDGTVHSYFNPYQNPYEAYINFQNILSDFTMELNQKLSQESKGEGYNKKAKRRSK